MTKAIRTSLLCALLLGCATDARTVDTECMILQRHEQVQIPPLVSIALDVVIDTHDDTSVERDAVAARLSSAVQVLTSGDTDEDGAPDATPARRVDVSLRTADPGCGEPVRLTTMSTAPGALPEAVRVAVQSLPECERSKPLATLASMVATEATSVGDRRFVIVTDEDEPGATEHVAALIERVEGGPSIALIAGFGLDAVTSWDALRREPGCTEGAIDARGAPSSIDAMRALEAAGAWITTGSICASRWMPALDVPLRAIDRSPCLCFDRSLDASETCTVIEHLEPSDDGARCADLEGRVPLADTPGSCEVLPSDGTSPGWIDASRTSASCRAHCGTSGLAWIGARPLPGSMVELNCGHATGDCADR
jgi:hypothetical protein